jgi:poly(A) polymerase
MQPVSHIHCDWLNAPALQAFWAVVPDGRLVGGAVRAAVQGKPMPDDLDMATSMPAEDVIAQARKLGVSAHPTGIAHGTVTLVSGGQACQVTTLRKDVETDGRHAVIETTSDWLEDAKRRDFTFNTLLLGRKGDVYDPLGTGLHDLDNGRIVFVGNAAERLAEDYLRLLRFYRFWAQTGAEDFLPDAKTRAALQKAAPYLKDLSAERITAEFTRLLSLQRAVPVLQNMFNDNVLAQFPTTDDWPERLSRVGVLQAEFALEDIAPRLLALRPDIAVNRPDYLRLPTKTWRQIEAITDIGILETPRDVRESLYRFGAEPVLQTIILQGDNPHELLPIAQSWDILSCPVRARDIMALEGLSGPALGARLTQLEEAWIDSDFSLTKTELLAL